MADEVKLEDIRAMRKLFEKGFSVGQAAKILHIPYVTVSRNFEEFKHQRKAFLKNDIVELSFIPKGTFQSIVNEAVKRKMTVKELVDRLFYYIVHDNLFSAVLDYKDDYKDGGHSEKETTATRSL